MSRQPRKTDLGSIGFDDVVASWFLREVGAPTSVQLCAWELIASGENALVCAPTGTGKTLAAFLFALDRLLTGKWEGETTRVLYVSPLRALGNDIRVNLLGPLGQLEALFEAQGRAPAPVAVHVRTGDTSEAERRRMRRVPPEVLITTPESLAILLISDSGRKTLEGVQTVIVDEIHAVAGEKRGVHLAASLENLAELAGEFQRIGLSATVASPRAVARWLGGSDPSGTPRKVRIVEGESSKVYDLRVEFASPTEDASPPGRGDGNPSWSAAARMAREVIDRSRSTLIFGNSRRSVEKIARLINGDAKEKLVYAHHGSLSRELRHEVEKRLKAGALRGIVATNSLELGIDVGAVDEVVLVETPPAVSSAVQRVGRAGHRVGAVSRGTLIAVHERDLLGAAVVVQALLRGEMEPLTVPRAPLDVLAQVVLSRVSQRSWKLDDLYDAVRRAAPYDSLERTAFDLVLDMLAGRYAQTRVPSLTPRVHLDRIEQTVTARKGARRLLYAAGGTIPDRGHYTLRHAETKAVIGELDEEFVWERSLGDSFTLGVQNWRIERITHADVFVTPARTSSSLAPFWRSDEFAGDAWFALRRARFLEQVDRDFDRKKIAQRLVDEHGFTSSAADRLFDYLDRQRKATGVSLPHRRHIIIELLPAAQGSHGRLLAVHTVWGGKINRALAFALKAAWEDRLGGRIEAVYDDDCVALELPEDHAGEPLSVLFGRNVVELVLSRLGQTGLFGAHFRRAAAVSLALPRAPFGRRVPLWQQRKRAKSLLEAVHSHPDFPAAVEAWRECIERAVDIDGLEERLCELESGKIRVSRVSTSFSSPFASQVLWKRTNELMYESDVPEAGAAGLTEHLLEKVVFSPALRPEIPARLAREIAAKLERTYPGYAPRDDLELVDWVYERRLLPRNRFDALIEAMGREKGRRREEIIEAVRGRLVAFSVAETDARRYICAAEQLPHLETDFGVTAAVLFSIGSDDPPGEETLRALSAAKRLAKNHHRPVDDDPAVALVALHLCYSGPLDLAELAAELPLRPERLEDAVSVLVDEQRAVVDPMLEGAVDAQICDAENLARLFALMRRERVFAHEPLPIALLPVFLARLGGIGASQPDLTEVLDRLCGLPATATAWERDILPARIPGYRKEMLDSLFAETDLRWFGCGKNRVTFAFEEDRPLLFGPASSPSQERIEEAAKLFPSSRGGYTPEELALASGSSTAEVTQKLWGLAWEGLAITETFAPVRAAAEPRPQNKMSEATRRRPGFRRGANRWRPNETSRSRWRLLAKPDGDEDIWDSRLRERDRARLLLDRYGVVFRELVAHELPGLSWRSVFPALRLLELSAEAISGMFFEGLGGIQFARPDAVAALVEGIDPELVFWISAADPISLCGTGLESLRSWRLPRRTSRSRLVFHGPRLVLVSERDGKRLDIRVEPDDPSLPRYLALLFDPARRDSGHRATSTVCVELINGASSLTSPYRPVFESALGSYGDHRGLNIDV